MAAREDVLRELAIICRRDLYAALWTIAYLATDASQEALEGALEGAREWAGAGLPENHLRLYQERWGVVPRGRA